MKKKFIKVTIERHDVTEDYDENFFDEYYIQEDEFTNWDVCIEKYNLIRSLLRCPRSKPKSKFKNL